MSVAAAPTYRGAVTTTRERLLDAAHHLAETQGWASVTMAKVAGLAGVSRQTVHNELGTRPALAQALALRELERFLEEVRARMAEQSDVGSAVRAGCEAALEMAEASSLVRTVVAPDGRDHGADSDLLATLTTESGLIVETATAVVSGELLRLFAPLPFDEREVQVAGEVVVRLVLSCVTRPSKPPAEAAAEIGWVFDLVLRGRAAEGRV